MKPNASNARAASESRRHRSTAAHAPSTRPPRPGPWRRARRSPRRHRLEDSRGSPPETRSALRDCASACSRRRCPPACYRPRTPTAGRPGSWCARDPGPARRVVGLDDLAAEHLTLEIAIDGLEQHRGVGHPVAQGLAGEVDPVPREDVDLAVQRQVVGVLGGEHLGQQPGAGAALVDGLRRQHARDHVLFAGLARVLNRTCSVTNSAAG